MHTAIGAEHNIICSVTCLRDAGAKPDLISKHFLSTDWLAMISKDVQPSFLFASKDRPRTKTSITLYIRIDDLLTTVLFTIVKHLSIGMILDTAFLH